MGIDYGFKRFEQTREIQYPLVSYSKVKAFFMTPIAVLIGMGGILLAKGESIFLAVFLAIILYLGTLIFCNLFGRKGGYLVGKIEIYPERVDMHLLTPLGFGMGRIETLDMKEFGSIHIKTDYEKGRLDDYELTLRGLHGIDLPLCEVDYKRRNPELAREIIEKISSDLKVPLENPGVLTTEQNNKRR